MTINGKKRLTVGAIVRRLSFGCASMDVFEVSVACGLAFVDEVQ